MDDTFVTFFLFPYADLDTVLLLPAPLPFLTPFALPLLLFGDLFVHESADAGRLFLLNFFFLLLLLMLLLNFFEVVVVALPYGLLPLLPLLLLLLPLLTCDDDDFTSRCCFDIPPCDPFKICGTAGAPISGSLPNFLLFNLRLRKRKEDEFFCCVVYGSPRTLRLLVELLLLAEEEEERLETRGCEFVYVEMTCADSAGVPGRAAPLPPAPAPTPAPRPLLPTLLDEREFLERSLPPRKEFSLREYDEVYGIWYVMWPCFFLCFFFQRWNVTFLSLFFFSTTSILVLVTHPFLFNRIMPASGSLVHTHTP